MTLLQRRGVCDLAKCPKTFWPGLYACLVLFEVKFSRASENKDVNFNFMGDFNYILSWNGAKGRAQEFRVA